MTEHGRQLVDIGRETRFTRIARSRPDLHVRPSPAVDPNRQISKSRSFANLRNFSDSVELTRTVGKYPAHGNSLRVAAVLAAKSAHDVRANDAPGARAAFSAAAAASSPTSPTRGYR